MLNILVEARQKAGVLVHYVPNERGACVFFREPLTSSILEAVGHNRR